MKKHLSSLLLIGALCLFLNQSTNAQQQPDDAQPQGQDPASYGNNPGNGRGNPGNPGELSNETRKTKSNQTEPASTDQGKEQGGSSASSSSGGSVVKKIVKKTKYVGGSSSGTTDRNLKVVSAGTPQNGGSTTIVKKTVTINNGNNANKTSQRNLYDSSEELDLERQELEIHRKKYAPLFESNHGRIVLNSYAEDKVAACKDYLPQPACKVLKPLCEVSDTARAIRYLRERSDYILYLNKDLKNHINYVKRTVDDHEDRVNLLHNLDKINQLMPSVKSAAPLIRLILDEDSEEELEKIVNAHLRYKQECAMHKENCFATQFPSYNRERACAVYNDICCCDNYKFHRYYKSITANDNNKLPENKDVKSMRRAIRRFVESSCAATCETCPTRFRAVEFAQELRKAYQCDKVKTPQPPRQENELKDLAPPVNFPVYDHDKQEQQDLDAYNSFATERSLNVEHIGKDGKKCTKPPRTHSGDSDDQPLPYNSVELF